MIGKVLCPVMNVAVDKKSARSKRMIREFKSKKYYLCCKTCVVLFDKNPSVYTNTEGIKS